LDAPLPNSNIEQWRMVVIDTGYALFVTSQYDVIFRFATKVMGKVAYPEHAYPELPEQQ